jgi:uncharacterized protein (DUF486 family)
MIENDKRNWKNALISSVIACTGSLLIVMANSQGYKNINWNGIFLLQPFICLFVFSPVLAIEAISRIQNIKYEKAIQKH